jgi:hypothetical protein
MTPSIAVITREQATANYCPLGAETATHDLPMNSWQITMNARQISKRPAVLSPTFIIALSIDRHAVEIRTENTDHEASVLP